MDDDELLRGCRVGVAADDALRSAVIAGTTEYADTGITEASHLARIYSLRTRHLAQQDLLLVNEAATLADLERLGQEATGQAVIRIQQHEGHRVVHTALLAGKPPTVRACLVHRLDDEETPVERLTLLENVHSTYFEAPVFLQPGEAFWVKDRTLFVRAVDGSVRTQAARPSRPDDMR